MLVTVITDASYCHKTHAAGYGVWVASDRGKKAFDGPLEGATDSAQAEAMAICNGLWHSIKEGLVWRGDTILFQTDCKAAISLLTEKRTARGHVNDNASEVTVCKWFNETISRNGLKFNFRHVKGHSKVQDKRSVTQDKCDSSAKKHMRAMRGRIECQQLQQQIKTSKPVKEVSSIRGNIDVWSNKLRSAVLRSTKYGG